MRDKFVTDSQEAYKLDDDDSSRLFWRQKKRDASLTHVNVVSLVADIEVSVDAVLVDVGDDGHVRHAVRGPAT